MRIVLAAKLDASRQLQTSEHFDGDVWRTRPIGSGLDGWRARTSDGLEASVVQFAAGARTKWHRHPGGQLLYVLRGSGLVGTTKRVERIQVGDLIMAGSDECHWHGASPDNEMVHLAVTPNRAVWSRAAVTDDE